MLSHKVLTRQDVGDAAGYYEDGADDYYTQEGEASAWQGKGAESLGLNGAVDSKRFRELLSGEVQPGVAITRDGTRKDSKSRLGIDLTFSAPKSVSLQALVGGDAQIIKAHDRAVARALEIAEERAQARKKIDGRSQVETTGNLVVAKFRHETSREQDPQLHTHAVVMNLTQRADGQWRALKNDELVKMNKYLGAVYRAELATELQRLGYNIRHDRDGLFELAHIDRKQLEGFSQRGAQIEARLSAAGLDRDTATPGQKQQATMQSRARKVSVERESLHAEWRGRAKELRIDFDRRGWAGQGAKGEGGRTVAREMAPESFPAALAARNAVRYAVDHLTERQSVMSERVLLDTAMKQAVGAAKLNHIQAEIRQQVEKGYLIQEAPKYRPADQIGQGEGQTRAAWVAELVAKGQDKRAAGERVDSAIARGGLVPVEPRYTTQTAREREKLIMQIERDGREKLPAIMTREAVADRLAGASLNAGQRSAVELILTTQNRVVAVQGFAGTGKSHMLNEAKAEIEGAGYQVRALAPYGSQVKALRELGVESNTLASFLKAKDKAIGAKTVLVVDEAGVVPARLMQQVLQVAEKAGARVVLVGDTAQTKAVEAGRPFDQLQVAGMATARMDEIQRQKDPVLKEAVELAAKGATTASLDRIKSINQIENDQERRAAVAKDFIQLPAGERDRTLIVSGTNEARREINRMVREDLGTAGKGVEFDTLIRRDTTQAERRFSKNYRVGDIIQPEKDFPRSGLKRGELYKVEDTGPGNRLTVRAESGVSITFSPMTHRQLSVYQPERAELARGDVVRITRNDAQLDVANGDRFKVADVAAGKLTLSDGKRTVELKADKPLHLDHAYATTVHSAQGLTSDRVLIDAHSKSLTTAKDVYYVAISRARHEARIYTDNVKELPAAIARESVKLAALDIERGTAQRRGRAETGKAEAGKGEAEKGRRHEPAPHSKTMPRVREDHSRDWAAGGRSR